MHSIKANTSAMWIIIERKEFEKLQRCCWPAIFYGPFVLSPIEEFNRPI
jgi:hypothetical protein